MKLLLRLILAQEEEKEQQERKRAGKKSALSSTEGIDFDPAEQKRKMNGIQKQYLNRDVTNLVRQVHPIHESVIPPSGKKVPIWEKYALTPEEAAQYFHIGINKIREIIKADRYAEYLMWNGNRTFIKRKMFEEFLNKTNSI